MSRETCLIRPMTEADKAPILDILDRTEMFTAEELDVALELIDAWLYRKEQKDYILITALVEGKPAGYVCYGPTPATEGTFDLYWIAVDPLLQGKGIGRELLRHTEQEVVGAGGKLVVIETSSQEKYRPTRGFYEKNGYAIEARIKDFYREGDDRLIFTRRFPPRS